MNITNPSRLAELQSLIDKANIAYYTDGSSIMEDARYDALKKELEKLNPLDIRLKQVGASVDNRTNILQKKNHTIPMGSLGKCMNKQEWLDWLKLNNLQSTVFHASHKMDGGSLSLEYKNGKFIAAISRGDGLVGEDITANVEKFKNIPLNCVLPNGNNFTGFVRGEVILTMGDWLEVDPDQTSNPRNLAVGIARRKDGTQSEYLKFYAFRIYDASGDLLGDLEHDLSSLLTKIGFDTAPSFIGKPEKVWEWFEEVNKDRQSLDYWIDGIVCKINDIDKQLSMGSSSNCPKGEIALKFESEAVSTTLNSVVWQVGNTGALSPVAQFDTIRIGGVNVSNALLCNTEIIDTLGVFIGDTISVIRAGDVIPKILEVVSKNKNRSPIEVPSKCPCCNSKVGHKNNINGSNSTVLYCLNDQCPAQVCGRIEKYVKSLDIQGIGGNVIESLVKDLNVKFPSDLYLLANRRNELANLTLTGGGRFGEKRADKVIAEIEKKKELTLSDFLGSLGIFGLGKRRVILIQDAVPGLLDELEDWFTDKLIKNASVAGVPNIAVRINEDLVSQKDIINKFITNGLVIKKVVKKQLKPGSKIFCITGSLSRTKNYFHDLMEMRGHQWTDTFSKGIDYLVCADVNSGSSKLVKAQKYGIKIISEDELMELIKK